VGVLVKKWPIPDPLDEAYLITAYREGNWGRVPGEFVETLEKEFARYHEAKYAVAVNNATVGLMLSYLALDIPPGSYFVSPAYTFIATITSGIILGLVPVFVDIDYETLNIDVGHLAEVLESDKESRIRLVVPVHFAGTPAEMDDILRLARKHGAYVVEDAAQAHGSSYRGRKVGAIGDAGVFSFQTSKIITAGEGGIVLTNNYEIYEKVWSYHNVGRSFGGAWYEHARIGWNFRMTEFQAAVILAQLRRFNDMLRRIRESAKIVYEELSKEEHIHVHRVPSHVETNHYFIPVSIDDELLRRGGKEKLSKILSDKGYSLIPGYLMPLYKQPALREPRWRLPVEEYSKLYLKNSEEACKKVMWVPHYELIHGEEYTIKYVNAIKSSTREILG
jgi:dTDP-4-amino-4,6-dideoxygalactose transaminase